MAEPEIPPRPEEQPPAASAEEVERLLAEASTLADEIASSAGVETPPGEPVAAEPPETAAPDVAAAQDDVDKKLAELQLEMSHVAGAEVEPQPPLASDAPPAEEDLSLVAAEGATPLGDIEMNDDLAADVNVSLDEPSPGETTDNARLAESTALHPNTGKPVKRPLARLMQHVSWLASRQLVRAVGRYAQLALPGVVVRTLVLLDRPFSGLSLSAKRSIGYVAIVTFFAGIASIVLPMFLQHNPYLEIER